jgi:hypothetical protein
MKRKTKLMMMIKKKDLLKKESLKLIKSRVKKY